MARRPSKHLRPARPLSAAGFARTESRRDGRWQVQSLPADRSVKPYVCPGCSHAIAPGQAHVVVWPVEPPLGQTSAVDSRRHWHGACWARRH
ncbi:hypothetical protein [Propioniciclava soli]|uniref:ATP/GTP-binding protein n=1 Tax=Propioniciclava soli TaxID=2775081 RepID=A0ABZ3C5T2_9ACTN|nr:hypothetical protein [Propioniciclava soli]